VQAVVAAAPQIVTNLNQTCLLLGEPEDCLDTLASVLRPYKGMSPAAAAEQVCYEYLPELFTDSHDRCVACL
jgi:hypothetical protein